MTRPFGIIERHASFTRQCISCQKAQEPTLCVLDAAKRHNACLRCKAKHLMHCNVSKSPSYQVDHRALSLPPMELEKASPRPGKKHVRLSPEAVQSQPHKKARCATPSRSSRVSIADISRTGGLTSKKRSERYVAYKEIIETVDAQLRAARRSLVDVDEGLMALRRAIEEVAKVEQNAGKAKGLDEVASGSTFVIPLVHTNSRLRFA